MKAAIRHRVDRVVGVPSRHGRLFRIAWAAAGILVVLAGLAMTVAPGPAVVVIPLGLAMLAGVFAGARALLHRSIERGVDLEQWLAGLPPAVKVAAAVAAGAVAVAVAWLVLTR